MRRKSTLSCHTARGHHCGQEISRRRRPCYGKKLEALANEPAIQAFQALADLGSLELETFSFNQFAAKGQTVASINAMMSAAVSVNRTSSDIKKFSDSFGIYTYNPKTDRFDKTAANDKIEVLFPGKKGAKSNSAKLTITYKTDAKTIDIDGYNYEIPTAVLGTMTVDGKSVLELKSALATHGDNLPKDASVDLTLGAYKANTKITNENNDLQVTFTFSQGTDEIVKMQMGAKHDNITYQKLKDLNKTVTEQWGDQTYTYTEFDTEEFAKLVKGANVRLTIANVQFLGSGDVSKVANALPSYDDAPKYPEWPQPDYDAENKLRQQLDERKISYEQYRTSIEALEKAWEVKREKYDEEYAAYIIANNAFEKKYNEAEISAFNNNIELSAFNVAKATKLATVKLQSVESKYEYDNYTTFYYDSEPILIFGDDSKQSFDQYSDQGFGNLITDIENLLKKFDR